jgi:hypothetical protein
MTDLITAFSGLEANWSNLAAVMRGMEERKVRLADFLSSVYGEPDELDGRSLTLHKKRTETIVRRLLRERAVTGRPDLGREGIVSGWEAFNAVQGYVQHDATRRGNPSEMGRIIRAMHDGSVAKELAPWLGVCPAGHEHFRFRAPTRPLACGACGRGFSRANLITWSKRDVL